jgi:threonine/homoserine/homoserine lactone efflux protein
MAAFAVAAFLLAIIPGPNVIYITTRGIEQGRRAAFASSWGVQTGTFVHIGAAILGLSAVIASSETLFTALKLGGAAYLIWMGINKLRAPLPDHDALASIDRDAQIRRVFAQGMLVQAMNPKVAIFFLAFLPQFIDPGRGGVPLQILAFGLLMIAIGTMTDAAYVLASGSIGRWLKRSPHIARQRERFAGAVYIVLGAVTALSGTGRR